MKSVVKLTSLFEVLVLRSTSKQELIQLWWRLDASVNYVIADSVNDLSHVRHQTITWSNTDVSLSRQTSVKF